MAFAESIGRKHVANGGETLHLFAAFVGLVFERDEHVGRDCLIAVDRVIGEGSGRPKGAAG